MNKFLLVAFFLFSINVFGQTERELINQQVWVPFTQSWEARDAKAFNRLHTTDIVRIGSKSLLIGEEYKKRNMKQMADGGGKNRTIEFAFDYRQVNGDIAYEMGFYRVKSPNDAESYISRFHVELRKVDGVWKIARDYDSSKIGHQRVNPKMYAALDFIHFE